ncbi:cytochrome P450 6a2-like [Chrysoperla carnea]|uniref:cytochrome P450 6a2-like n=1 Tax=Chrysoperla carnea TaxID=189513 RepID=UPI001D099DA7|nr:cytochrome P450 6a2-like [Chrysoperla carnea]
MWVDLLLFVALLIGIFTIFYTWNYDYWNKRRLPYVKPIFPFGSLKDVILFKKTFSSLLDDWYYKYKDYKYIGVYFGRHPVLFIRDAQLIKDVMVKHFNHFQDNNARINEKADPIAGNNPFMLKGGRWKSTRAHLTPGFTALKLKQMFPNMLSVSERLISYIQQNIDSSKNIIEAKDLSTNFATEVFTLAALNIKSDSFENPNSQFKTIAGDLLAGSHLKLFITWTLTIVDPALAVLLRIRILSKKGEMYFRKAISDVLAYREQNNLVINDFCNYLNNIHLKNSDFTRDDVVSNIVTIFLDGVETSSQILRFLLREVAAYPEVFKKLRNEIDTIKSKYDDKITFDGLQEMTYLDSCLFESLRIYSTLLTTMRVCTQPFEFPPPKEGEPGLKIQPGMGVLLPLFSIHNDEKLHPNPKEFNPERFHNEEMKVQAKANFYGFGDGPRMCLGMRYGSLVVKLGVAIIISNFDVTVNEKTKERPKNISPSFLFAPSFEPNLDFHKRATIYK